MFTLNCILAHTLLAFATLLAGLRAVLRQNRAAYLLAPLPAGTFAGGASPNSLLMVLPLERSAAASARRALPDRPDIRPQFG